MAKAVKYREEFAEQAQNYALLGATDVEIAGFLHVSVRTVHNWKNEHPEFAEALACGKEHADAKVLGASYRNALGGNATMQIFWLKNRLGWRDKVDAEISGKGGAPIQVVMTTTDEAL